MQMYMFTYKVADREILPIARHDGDLEAATKEIAYILSQSPLNKLVTGSVKPVTEAEFRAEKDRINKLNAGRVPIDEITQGEPNRILSDPQLVVGT